MNKYLFMGIFSLAVSGTLHASEFPVTVESCGHPIIFDAPPQRAVIQDLNMSEMAFALNLQPNIVGVTGISGWYKSTPAFKQQQGNIPELAPKYPSLETLLAVKPDFFFAGWNYGMRPGGEVTPQTLAPFGVKTLELSESCIHVDKNRPRASMDLLYSDMLTLGKIFGKAELAQQIIERWKAKIAALHGKIANQPVQKVFLYDSGEDKPLTSGEYAMPTAIVEAAGGKNVMDTMKTSWATTSWETVASTQPDLIILMDYQNGGSTATKQAFLEAHPLMKLTPAVRQQRYLKLRYEELTPGPANIEAINKLVYALYPDAFK
ncbi:ABC transporter substrate-binding protein [Buttiauxella warmboldiae]|nr:ABC transporter substrate-binding protein [Buttiauxella warmboldiae]